MLLDSFSLFLRKLSHPHGWAYAKKLTSKRRGRSSLSHGSSHGITTLESLENRTLLSTQNGFLYSPSGYLSPPSADDAEVIARNYLSAHTSELGIVSSDLDNLTLTARTTGGEGQLTNLYFQQTYSGLPIDSGTANVTIDAQGRVLSVGNRLIDSVAGKVTLPGKVHHSSERAVTDAASALGIVTPNGISYLGTDVVNGQQVDTFSGGNVSRDVIPVRRVLSLDPNGNLSRAWNVVIRSVDTADWIDINVNEVSGAVLYHNNWTRYESGDSFGGSSGASGSSFATGNSTSNLGTGSYNVYPLPISGPADGTRVLVSDPADYRASPYGWHDIDGLLGADFTTTLGNNVSAQEDANGDDFGGFQPDGGPLLNFDFDLDLSSPSLTGSNQSAAITQLFYTLNILHDLQYQYGFDETSGNFQANNYGHDGLGNDPVLADAEDLYAAHQASFSTPPDGSSPRMQLPDFFSGSPGNHDLALANDIIIHEFAHGISSRLTGGPSNANALSSRQSQALDEGWSDWWALMLTQKSTDTKLDPQAIGTWGDPTADSDSGIRRYPYSFDMTVNPLTLGDYNAESEAHNAGEIWASALWDLNWLYRERYGYSSDLYDGTGGNNRLMQTVMDALKIQPANPSFLDARDAILAADQALSGGSNQDLIWQAFARRGFGAYAYDHEEMSLGQTAADSLLVAENFNVPGDIVDDFVDESSLANVINPNSLTAGWISAPTDVDYFTFTANVGETVHLDLSFPTDKFTPAASSTIAVKDFSSPDGELTGTSLSFVAQSWLPNSTVIYRVRVQNPSFTEAGGYMLRLRIDDAGDSAATARRVPVTSVQGGTLETYGDFDYFAFSVTAGQTLGFVTTPLSSTNPMLTLLDTDGFTPLSDSDDLNAPSGLINSSISGYTFTTAGTYYVRVSSRDSRDRGTYEFQIYDPFGISDDVGNDAVSARKLTAPDQNLAVTLDVAGDSDWFRYNLTAGEKYNFSSLLNTISDRILYLYDHDGRTTVAHNNGNSEFSYTPQRSGYYYLRIGSYSNNHTGTLTLQSTAGVSDDHSDAFNFATPIAIPSITSGDIETFGDQDYFRFHAVAGQIYEITGNFLTLPDYQMYLFKSDGVSYLNGAYEPGNGSGTPPHFTFTPVTTGDYLIEILAYHHTSLGAYTLQIAQHNSAPILQNYIQTNLPTITEDVDDALNTGTLISDIIASFPAGQFTDPDPADPQGLALAYAPNTSGDWQYSSDDGAHWTSVTGVSFNNVLLLPSAPGWRLRFSPDLDFNGGNTLYFFAWDQSSGTPGSTMSVTFTGGDTSLSNSFSTLHIDTTPVNDAPVLTATATIKLRDLFVDIAPDDVFPTSLPQMVNAFGAQVSITDSDIGAQRGFAFINADQTHGKWQYSQSYGYPWLDFGSLSESDARLLLIDSSTSIRFTPNPGFTGTATITFVAWDLTTGTDGQTASARVRGGSTAFSSNSCTFSVTVTPRFSPVLDPAGNPTLTSIPEDAFNNNGTSVYDLINSTPLGSNYITDANAQDSLGIALYSAPNSGGTWQYSISNGDTWTNISGVSATHALLLGADRGGYMRIRFVPLANFNGTRQIYFRAWDKATGTNDNFGYADISSYGGATPFSAKADSATITVTPVNDAPLLYNTYNPVVSSINKSALNNPGFKVSAMIASVAPNDYISDVDGGPEGIAIYAVQDVSGHWEYSLNNGVAGSWVSIGAVSPTNALLLKSDASTYLRFVPNTITTGDRKIFFRAWDQSAGTAGTKVDASVFGTTTPFSAGADSLTLTVNNGLDAPVLNPAGTPTFPTISRTNSNPTGISILDLIASAGPNYITDPETTDPQGIAIYGAPNSGGTWEYSLDSGAHWTSVGAVDQTHSLLLRAIASTLIRFKPLATFTGTRQISFSAWDQSTGAEGSKVDTNTRGGATSFSLARDTASVSVN